MTRIMLFVAILLNYSCNTTKNVVYSDFETLDTLVVSSTRIQEPNDNELPKYNPAAERVHDLLHTKLELSFDWPNQLVFGEAELTFSPVFYDSDFLVLDAHNFDIQSIAINRNSELEYSYNGKQIFIQLDKKYTQEEEYKVSIVYTAKPAEQKEGAYYGGQGLYFVNHDNADSSNPQQIWTQGETEYNSRWFPTIDKPNERCTQEVFLTVDKKFKTLSNGVMISSEENDDGTRTDYWKQSLPHAPYLFSIVVGEYAVVDDQWEDTPISYYVEPEYAIDAEQIFDHTPEMMEFFSDILDFPYPWEKYSQVVVREFVSGAMENTTCSIFGDFVQKTSNELIDSGNDNIVAHELFHHWFGDLVTCESWANLTLNEGFANYSEYLWQEYKYGSYEAEHHRINEKNAYIESTFAGTHPLIHYGYNDKEDMFDAHSYNKGGLVLHMLRNYVGDRAFFKSLNKYLTENQYTAVEVDELRLAFEDTTGKDLNWFFDQWYLDEGHPSLAYDYEYDASANTVMLDISQTQDPDEHRPIFIMPTTVTVYYKDKSSEIFPIIINERNQAFDLKTKEAPAVVVVDGKHDLLASIDYDFSTEEWMYLYNLSTEFEDKFSALKALKLKPVATEVFKNAANHPYYYFRNMALGYEFATYNDEDLADIIVNDKHSKVRANALSILIEKSPKTAFKVAKEIINKEKSIRVLSKAIKCLYKNDKKLGIKYADSLYNSDRRVMKITLLDIFSASEDEKYIPYLNKALVESNQYEFFPIARFHYNLASKSGLVQKLNACTALKEIALRKDENNFKKITAVQNIDKLKKSIQASQNKDHPEENTQISDAVDELDNTINNIIESETNIDLRTKYMSVIETQ